MLYVRICECVKERARGHPNKSEWMFGRSVGRFVCQCVSQSVGDGQWRSEGCVADG